MNTRTTFRGKAATKAAVLVAALVAGAGIGLGAVYGIGGFDGNPAGGTCAATPARAAELKPLMTGDVAAVVPSQKPTDVSGLAFTGPDGAARTLADWRGRVVLLNLWATWCPPCKAEMPALDRLQARVGSKDFEVVTVNVDTGAPEKRKAFLAEAGIGALADHADPSMRIFKALQAAGLARGLPTTLVVDRDGCELATLNGPAEWDGAAATALVRAALALPGPGAGR
jgi:thiol-disulfide isomerase/thioredoxin